LFGEDAQIGFQGRFAHERSIVSRQTVEWLSRE
jgi:hypothetical protein